MKVGKMGYMLALLVILLGRAVAWAGPPFQTDDPEPIDYKNYEFYTFGVTDGTGKEMDSAVPAAEFNWGALPNLHLHLIVPLAEIFPSTNPKFGPSGPSEVGLGDLEAGIKYRFVQETKHRPMIGTFVMFELPTGDATKGLGVGKTWYKVPIWVQKSFGPWTTYGGAGATLFNHVDGFNNFAFAGGLLQRDIGKKWTLGTEVFYHGSEGTAPPQTGSAVMVDVGGYYKFKDPGFQLLFAYGHSVAGQAENYAYLGLYWTWGKKSEKDDKDSKDSALNRFAPPFGQTGGQMGGRQGRW